PTLVNQFSLSASYSALAADTSAANASIDYAEDLGLSGLQPGAFPRFELVQYVDIGSQPGSLVQYQVASYAVSDGLSVRFRKNNVKLNFHASRGQVNTFRPRNPSGRFAFNGKLTSLPGLNNTGDTFAQFILGLSERSEHSSVVHPSYFRSEQYQLTASDEYQMTPNFNATISLGLQIDTPRRDKYDRQSSL